MQIAGPGAVMKQENWRIFSGDGEIHPGYYSRLPRAAVIYEVFVVSDIGPIS